MAKKRRARDIDPEPHRGTPDRVKIRRARHMDLPAIVRMSTGINEIENFPGQKMKARDFRHFLEGGDSMMLVAVVPGRARGKEEVVGYVAVYRSENYYYLPYAVTKKGWRRRGIGSALLQEVEKLAKDEKVEYILMSVYLYNDRVHTFLKVRGYIPGKKLIQYSKIISNKGSK